MFTLIAFIITIGLVWLTLWGTRRRTVTELRKVLRINLGISASAVLMGGGCTALVHHMIFNGGSETEWQSWAWDAYVLFPKTTLPVMGICLLFISVTTLVTAASPKKNSVFSAVVRQTASVAASVILLFLAAFYSAMAETEEMPLRVFILLFGICEALFMRLSFVIETALRLLAEKKR